MNGIYWGLGTLQIMKSLEEIDKIKIIEFIKSCQHPNGIL